MLALGQTSSPKQNKINKKKSLPSLRTAEMGIGAEVKKKDLILIIITSIKWMLTYVLGAVLKHFMCIRVILSVTLRNWYHSYLYFAYEETEEWMDKWLAHFLITGEQWRWDNNPKLRFQTPHSQLSHGAGSLSLILIRTKMKFKK